MLENWCFEEKVLNLLSCHVDTKEPLPKNLIEKLIKAKNVNEGLMMLRQVYLATLDLTIHGYVYNSDSKNCSKDILESSATSKTESKMVPQTAAELQALVDRLRPEISLIDNPANCNMLRNFGHLMNQYSAAYYGYLWAEVLSADMFAAKFASDPFDAVSGMEYRKKVLAVGGVGKIADHLEGFLGRKPTEDAFLKSRGII